jgi:predicted 3-demethylubiquinone-9 3-methyltransferase (glyoxalase superfamily)
MEKIQINPQKITPFLWFNNNAEEAITYYTSVFKNRALKKLFETVQAAPDRKERS